MVGNDWSVILWSSSAGCHMFSEQFKPSLNYVSTRFSSGSLGTSVFDTDVYLVGASGGVYALLAAHLANVLLVSRLGICYLFPSEINSKKQTLTQALDWPGQTLHGTGIECGHSTRSSQFSSDPSNLFEALCGTHLFVPLLCFADLTCTRAPPLLLLHIWRQYKRKHYHEVAKKSSGATSDCLHLTSLKMPFLACTTIACKPF